MTFNKYPSLGESEFKPPTARCICCDCTDTDLLVLRMSDGVSAYWVMVNYQRGIGLCNHCYADHTYRKIKESVQSVISAESE